METLYASRKHRLYAPGLSHLAQPSTSKIFSLFQHNINFALPIACFNMMSNVLQQGSYIMLQLFIDIT